MPIDHRTSRQSRLAISLVILIILGQSLLSTIGFEALASLRAYVSGESIYSKAQKNALLHLLLYLDEPSVEDFRAFEGALAIAQADNRARVEMEREAPDLVITRRHLLAALNAEEDLHRLIWMFRVARREPHFARAVDLWQQAEGLLDKINTIAQTARRQVEVRGAKSLDLAPLRREVARLNEELSRLEDAFAGEIGDGARMLERILLVLNLGAGLLLLGLGYRYIIRSIQAQAAQNLELTGLLRTMSEAVILLGEQDEVVSMNTAAEALLGRQSHDCVGRNATDLFRSEPSGTNPLEGGNGSEAFALWAVSPHLDGEPTLLQASLRRFTARRMERATLVLRPIGQAEQALVNERRRHHLAEQELLQKALSDPLTGLANREALQGHVATLMTVAAKTELNFVLLVLDLDGFKGVNDRHGHLVGDEVLAGVARAFRSTLRHSDHLFRVGGDEFVAVLAGDVEAAPVDKAIDRLRQAAAQSVHPDGESHRLSVSIGQASFPADGAALEDLLRVADQRMYEDKQRLKDR